MKPHNASKPRRTIECMNQVLPNILLAAFIMSSPRFLTCLRYLYQFLGYSCQPVCLQQTVPCRPSPSVSKLRLTAIAYWHYPNRNPLTYCHNQRSKGGETWLKKHYCGNWTRLCIEQSC
jgi:hypothetical protein